MMRDSAGQRLRSAGLLAALTAVLAGAVVAGCSSKVDGKPLANEQELAEYQAEATSSSQAATSSSRAAAATRAKTTSCSTFRTNAAMAITAANAFVGAANSNAPDLPVKRDAAVRAQNESADKVSATIVSGLDATLASALRTYVTGARAFAVEIGRVPPNSGALNGAGNTDTANRRRVGELC